MNNGACLVKIIANMAVFLEFTDEEFLNPDAAIEMMESISAELQLLDSDEKNKFIEELREVSKEYKDEKAVFIRSLPETFGLK